MTAAVLAFAVTMSPPLEAQVCLGSSEASPGWLAMDAGRAAKDAIVAGGDAGWQLTPTVALYSDLNMTVYPHGDPQRNHLGIGAAYTFSKSERFGVCTTSGVDIERIGDLHVLRIPVGVSFGWTTSFNDSVPRLGFRVEPFLVYSRETIARFYHSTGFVSARAAVVFHVHQLILGLHHEQAFDGDAQWHTLGRIGLAFQ